MAAPCCPDRAGMRGRPYTPHWFIWHDDQGRIDTHSTWSFGGLPKNDVELSASVRGMMNEAGCPMLYGDQTKRWYMWDGSGRYAPQRAGFDTRMTKLVALWHKQAIDQVWPAVLADIRRYPAQQQAQLRKQAEAAWNEHRVFGRRIWNDAGQRAVLNQFREVFTVDMDTVDAGTGKIVVDNGVISYAQILRDGYVEPQHFDSSELVTRRMGRGVRWEPDARCPAFERYLRESVPDEEQRWWLLWRVAGSMFGLQRRKGFLNLIGARDSGKSTFTDLIAHIVADYARPVPVETFLSKHSGDAGFRQHDLMAARFVYTHEPNAGALYDVSFMKQITGRDTQRTAGKYEKPISWQPQCTPFIGSNNPIRFNTADDAMMTRQEAVLFVRSYDTPDQHLLDRLKTEKNGILRLLLGTVCWESRNGLPELPFSSVQLREQMAEDMDDALRFVHGYIERGLLREVGPEWPVYKCVPISRLYDAYRIHWCEEEGVKAVSRKVFRDVLSRKYHPGRSGEARVFTGLASTSAWGI